jgi:hypothetical protein
VPNFSLGLKIMYRLLSSRKRLVLKVLVQVAKCNVPVFRPVGVRRDSFLSSGLVSCGIALNNSCTLATLKAGYVRDVRFYIFQGSHKCSFFFK